jgi:hypothetical protein
MERAAAMVRSLKANVTREEALRHFTGGARGMAAAVLRGRARAMAVLYIPYRLFRVKIRNGGSEEKRVYALDAVEGTLDLFEFLEMPVERELVTVESRNALSSLLPAEQARERLMGKVRRVVFSRGFMRLRDWEMEAAVADEFHVPYWVCFRGAGQAAKLEILDAVRRRLEGGKVRELVERWLQASSMDSSTAEDGLEQASP